MRHFTTCFLLSTLCLLAVNGKSIYFPPADHHTDDEVANDMEIKWAQFKAEYKKQYNTNSLEEYHRRLIWEANQRYIDKHNEEYEHGLHTYTLGMNAFGDLTQREFVENHLTKISAEDLKRIEETASLYMSPLNAMGPVPDEVDWRKKGMVTPVKDQGQCGSCWAFSSTGALEGQYFRKVSKLVSFSEQQLVDCSKREGNQGCNGGLMEYAFNYVLKSGIETEGDYPYTARDGRCAFNSSKVVTKITGKVKIPRDENKLQEASANIGPISVAIDASQPSFQLYKSGIYNERACSSTQLDHAVLLIGYGLDGAQKVPFWLVKNSWGTGWGEQGFIRMSRNKHNQCGIASMALYPQI